MEPVIIRDREAAGVGKTVNSILEEPKRFRDSVKKSGGKYGSGGVLA